jgi:uncharacterized protein
MRWKATALLVALLGSSSIVACSASDAVGLSSPSSVSEAQNSETELSADRTTLPTETATTVAVSATSADSSAMKLVLAGRSQVGVTTSYDPSYVRISYPGGDVPMNTGVCTDVVIRGLRAVSIDLQVNVHKDMRANFSRYPKIWGLRKPDTNIDHRRVPNLETYFTRRGYAKPISTKANDYLPGDIVTWRIPLAHIGIVSDRTTSDGTPLIIHNIGGGAKEEDLLFRYKINGHFRVLN